MQSRIAAGSLPGLRGRMRWRPAVHVEPPCSFRDIPVAKLIDPLDMLPTHAISAHGVFGRRRARLRWRSALVMSLASAGFERWSWPRSLPQQPWQWLWPVRTTIRLSGRSRRTSTTSSPLPSPPQIDHRIGSGTGGRDGGACGHRPATSTSKPRFVMAFEATQKRLVVDKKQVLSSPVSIGCRSVICGLLGMPLH